MLRKVVVLGLVAAATALGHNEAEVTYQTGVARAKAHEAAMQSEQDIARLNAAVFPSEPAGKHSAWHHESADSMEAHYKGIASQSFGFDPTAKHAPAAAAKAKAVAHKQQAAAKTAAAAHPPKKAAPKKAAPPPPKPTARQEAAAEEKRHAVLSDQVWGKPTKDVAWKHQGSKAELAHIAEVNAATEPVARKGTHMYAETASQEEAKFAKEVVSAFPASWFAAKKAPAKGGKQAKGGESKEHALKNKLWGKPEMRQQHLHNNLAASEKQIRTERSAAQKSGEGELSGLAKLSSEVLPFSHAFSHEHKALKTSKAVQKHAVHKQVMHKAAHGAVKAQ